MKEIFIFKVDITKSRNYNLTIYSGLIFIYFFRFFALFIIGIANAIPLPLTGSVLSIWLSESGYSTALIGTFSLLSLPFSFKILWTLAIDYLIPPAWKNCQRKFWLLTGVAGMALTFLGMSFIDPAISPWTLAIFLILLSSLAGCVYIAGIAYELESLDESDYRTGSACVITGYRIGLLLAGAGALYLSSFYGWAHVFRCMALLLTLGALVIVLLPEPFKSKEILTAKRERLHLYPSARHAFFYEVLVEPCKRFFLKEHAFKLLLFIFLVKIGDELIKEMSGPFYLSLGFSKIDLANATKMWGMAATILGAFLAAKFLKNKNSLILFVAQINLLHAFTLICFGILSLVGKSNLLLYISNAIENMSGGMVMTAFITFLWRTCDKNYASVQYAWLWSAYLFKSRLVSCLGGIMAGMCSWTLFFFFVAFLAIAAALGARAIAKKVSLASRSLALIEGHSR